MNPRTTARRLPRSVQFLGVSLLMLMAGCSESPAARVAKAEPPVTPTATPTTTQPTSTPAAQPASQPAGTAPGASGGAPSSTQSNTSPSATPAAASPGQNGGTLETAMFGAGCFWGVEHIFRKDIPGVVEAVSGYSGGKTVNPTYQEICREDTGHAEVVQVKFDPTKTSYAKIVDAFFRLHDPTQVNRQGPDIGDQYRSVIYFYTAEQQKVAEEVKKARASKYTKPIATTIEPAQQFYRAEEYHQKYYLKNGQEPYCHVLQPE
jgi:methionine-S-sulfoxide reductase